VIDLSWFEMYTEQDGRREADSIKPYGS